MAAGSKSEREQVRDSTVERSSDKWDSWYFFLRVLKITVSYPAGKSQLELLQALK